MSDFVHLHTHSYYSLLDDVPLSDEIISGTEQRIKKKIS